MGDLALNAMSVEEEIATMETLWDDVPMDWNEAKQEILKHTQC